MADNIPESQENVLTTMGLVLSDWVTKSFSEQQNLHFVYDEKLSYETAIPKYRSDNDLEQNAEVPYPLLAFRRSVMRHSEKSPGRRMGRMLVKQLIDNLPETTQARLLRSVHGEIDVEFMFISPNIIEVENFEVCYLGEEGISAEKQLNVDLPSEYNCSLPYYVEWDILELKEFEDNGNYFKTLQGKCTIRGHFMVFRANKSIITEIQGRIKQLPGKDLIKNIQITADS